MLWERLRCLVEESSVSPRGDCRVVGLMPALCAAPCGFGPFSQRVPGFPPGFLTPAKDSHMKPIGSSGNVSE